MHADYHLHTATSPDCSVPALEQIEACKALGLTDICITDHMEIAFPAPGDWSMDVPAYRRMYESLEYSGIDGGWFPQQDGGHGGPGGPDPVGEF